MERSEHALPSLPPVLRQIRPPEVLSPSRFSDLRRCPLSVVHGLREEELLPPNPLAILGELIHTVRHELRDRPLGSDEEVGDAVDAAFGAGKARIEAELAGDPSTRRFVPLDRAIDRTSWLERMASLREWVAVSSGASRTKAHRDRGRPRVTQEPGHNRRASSAEVPVGSERALRAPALRLSGRPDLIERDPEGVLHVTDFKTGRVVDGNGRPFGGYALQVRLYGLMIERIDPSSAVRLWLQGTERVEVPWDAAGRKVRVTGLEAELAAGGLCDDFVWLFGLEPSEKLPHHGAFAHPRNFHGESPGRSSPSALRLRVFVGEAGPSE